MTGTFCKYLPLRCRSLLLALSLCLSCSAMAQSYEDGRSAYVRGDYERAYDILLPLAEAGNSNAQKVLGIMYDYGHGVEKDQTQALEWFLHSARQGNAAVQYQVGAKYFRGEGTEQDYRAAADWWEQAASGGQVDAQFNLGLMYYRGLGVEENHNRAAELFRQAAGQDHSYAQYSLGVMHSFGQSVAQDHAAALKWFRQAADQGLAQAQFNLGVYYEKGYAVDQDIETARVWFERAAAQNLEEAITKLDALSTGTDTSGDMEHPDEAAPVPEVESAPAEQTASAPATALLEENDTAVATAPVETPGTPSRTPASGGIRNSEWVLTQSPDRYTLQLASVTDEQDIIEFIRERDIVQDAAYIRVIIDGVTRYNALYGIYDSYDNALQAARELPPSLGGIQPWARNIRVLQDLVEQARQ